MKRKRLRKQGSGSHGNDDSNEAGTFFKVPKVEEDEHPPASLQQQPLPGNTGNISPACVSTQRASLGPVSPSHDGRNASPRPFSPQPASPGPVSPHHDGRNSHSSQMCVSYKGKEPMSPHVASNGKGYARRSLALCIKDPAPEPGLIPMKRVHESHALIIPKEEPLTDDIADEVPIAVIHPGQLFLFLYELHLFSALSHEILGIVFIPLCWSAC